jgi:hypothetical protein
MMDDREDRLDNLIRDAARDYNAPPATPRAAIWEAIRASREAARTEVRPPAVRPGRSPLRLVFAIAALLALGISIGRLTVPARSGSAAAPAQPTLAAAPEASAAAAAAAAEQRERGEAAARFATDDHLTQVETLLTEFGTRPAATDFSAQAQDLLTDTRLLLDSKRVVDPRTRKLLEDLELVLAQIATLDPREKNRNRELIADGLAQSHLRTRLRNAIPAGSAIRL